MISPDILEFFDSFVSTLPPKQKTIAESLLFNKTYHILQVYDNETSKLILKDRHTGGTVDFVKYVKSKCNC